MANFQAIQLPDLKFPITVKEISLRCEQGQDKLMSVPLQKIPRCGLMLLALLLGVSGCSSHENASSRARPVQKYYRPGYVHPPVMPVQRVQESFSEMPEDEPPPVKVKKRPQIKAADQPQPRAMPVLDNSLPEQIWQPAITRQTSLELKS